jgi:Tfp pilus assembly protein PilV
MIKQLISNNSGDTIVEVLISLVIVAFVVTGAYVTSHDSLSNIVAARERLQALGIAQSQVEDLRAESAHLSSYWPSYNVPLNSGYHGSICFGLAGGTTLKAVDSTISPLCNVNGYKISIIDLNPTTPTDAANHISTHTFKVAITWASASTSSTSAGGQLSLFYRVTPQ